MRSTAYKLKIEDIIHGRYVRSAEGEPSRLITPWGQEVLRAHIIATVIDKFTSGNGGYGSLRLDDGSGTIRAKLWGEDVEQIQKIEIGDVVELIGMIREYEGEIHLVPEVLKRVEDSNWELVHELEVLRAKRKLAAEGKRPKPSLKVKPGVETEELHPSVEVQREMGAVEELEEISLPKVPDDVKKKVLLALDKLEGEDGVSSIDLAAELDISQREVEDVLRVLLVDGEIFEPKAGRFKRLR